MAEKTVKVRVAVAVDVTGHWNAAGWCCDAQGVVAEAKGPLCGDPRVYWLSAELAVPGKFEPEVAAEVNDGD